MKVGIFSECYLPMKNGVVVSVLIFAKGLREQGIQVYVFAPSFPGYTDHDHAVFRYPSFCFPFGPVYPVAIPFSCSINSALARLGLDIIHTQSPFALGRAGARVASRMGLPLVTTYHTLIEHYTHYVLPVPTRFARRMAIKISRDYCNRADWVVVPTKGVVPILRGYGVRSPIEVIPTGIDLSFTQRGWLEPIRRRWGIPDGAPLLCFVGRVAKEKNMDLLLASFRLILEGEPRAHLLVVGPGPLGRDCRRMAAQMGMGDRVWFTGGLERREALRCLADSDLCLFTSQTETQGLVLVEAMALGVPCIAVRATGAVDVLTPGQDSLMTEPEPLPFAKAALSLLRNPETRRLMGEAARANAERFSAQACAKRLAALYRDLVSTRGPGR